MLLDNVLGDPVERIEYENIANYWIGTVNNFMNIFEIFEEKKGVAYVS